MIPDKAVEAAADALHADNCPEDMHDCVCSDWAREAEIALEAAAPVIREEQRIYYCADCRAYHLTSKK